MRDSAPRRISARSWFVAVLAAAASLGFAASAHASNYVVLYKGNAVPASAALEQPRN